MEDIEKVKHLVLRELMKRRKLGGAHMPLDNVTKNLPDEFLHDKKGRKAIDKAIKSLVNLRWILAMKKRTGKDSDIHISINPRKTKEISNYLII